MQQNIHKSLNKTSESTEKLETSLFCLYLLNCLKNSMLGSQNRTLYNEASTILYSIILCSIFDQSDGSSYDIKSKLQGKKQNNTFDKNNLNYVTKKPSN